MRGLGLRVSERARALLVLALALLMGLLYLLTAPPWQHYDEPTHFEYAWLIADRGRLPRPNEQDAPMRRAVAASMLEHRFFWNVGYPDLLSDDTPIWIGISELGHPPLYYTLVSLPLRLVRHTDMSTQLYVARLASLAMFLATVMAALGTMGTLLPPGHPLRWAVPLAMVLLPPFAHHMIAVNNDVGAALAVTLFLWAAAVALLREGMTRGRVAALLGAAMLAVAMKNTAGLVVLTVPLVLLMAWWLRRGWPWRWAGLTAAGLALVGLLATVSWGDAAFWYRQDVGAAQAGPTRVTLPAGTGPTTALALEVVPGGARRTLQAPLLPASVRLFWGETVTVGGWLWASRPAQVASPGLLLSEAGSTDFIALSEPMTVTTTPTFVAHQYWVPPTVRSALYYLPGELQEASEQGPLTLYLSGAFVATGELPAEARPTRYDPAAPLPAEMAARNQVRNPWAAQPWPRLRPWVNRTTERYIRRAPSFLFAALLDLPRNGPFLLGQVLPWLVDNLFGAFGWGHVRLTGAGWSWLFRGTVLLALLGAGRWLWAARGRGYPRWVAPALLVLALVGAAIWLGALTWPLPFTWARVPLPAARYTYPAILPTMLLLVGGWWALWPRRYRAAALAVLLAALLALNGAALYTITTFYATRPPPW